MQVAGYPHYENVCSNILAFYFDTTKEHGLADMLLQALMSCLGATRTATVFETEDVDREVETNEGRRLDIVINAGDFIVGIENKIWAALYNDLSDYARLLANLAKDEEIPEENIYRVVLTLHPLGSQERARICQIGFKNVTYKELILKTRGLVGKYASAADTKFLTYFIDFMQTIEALEGGVTDSAQTKFFRENAARLHELGLAYWEFIKERPRAIQALLDERLGAKLLEANVLTRWIHAKYMLAIHIKALNENADKGIDIQAHFGPDGWRIQIFCLCRTESRTPPKNCEEYFRKIQPSFGIEEYKNNGWNIELRLTATTPDDEIASRLDEAVRKIMQALGYDLAALNRNS